MHVCFNSSIRHLINYLCVINKWPLYNKTILCPILNFYICRLRLISYPSHLDFTKYINNRNDVNEKIIIVTAIVLRTFCDNYQQSAIEIGLERK